MGEDMKIAAIVFFILAGLGTLSAINTVVVDGPNRPDEFENLVGYAVGAFLVPLAFLIIGLVLWNKARDGGRDSAAIPEPGESRDPY